MLKEELKKILKTHLPHSIILLYWEYRNYKKRYSSKNKEYVFDVIFSVGDACRPAYYLRECGLRLWSNPLDWMMNYSLNVVIHLYQTKFTDFFINFTEDTQQSHRFIDKKNNIVSLHYSNIATCNEAFRETMKNRFEKSNKKLLKAKRICFISNRNEDSRNFTDFLKEMSRLYSGKITYINVRNNSKINGMTISIKEKISDKLELIEYEFSDIHPNGWSEGTNPDFWKGNSYLWNSLLDKISMKMNFLSYLRARRTQKY